MDAAGAVVELDYRLDDVSMYTAFGTTLTNTITISPVSISSAGEYTCIVTVTASGVCGGGSGKNCPTNTSDVVSLTVPSKC